MWRGRKGVHLEGQEGQSGRPCRDPGEKGKGLDIPWRGHGEELRRGDNMTWHYRLHRSRTTQIQTNTGIFLFPGVRIGETGCAWQDHGSSLDQAALEGFVAVPRALRGLESPRVRNARGLNVISQGEVE